MNKTAVKNNSKKSIAKMINDVAEEIARKEAGTVLRHTQLAEKLGVKYTAEEKTKYYSRVLALQRILKDQHKVFLESLFGFGYQIAAPGDEIRICHRKLNRGFKQVNRTINEMNNINTKKITDRQKKKFTISERDRLTAIFSTLRGSVLYDDGSLKINK